MKLVMHSSQLWTASACVAAAVAAVLLNTLSSCTGTEFNVDKDDETVNAKLPGEICPKIVETSKDEHDPAAARASGTLIVNPNPTLIDVIMSVRTKVVMRNNRCFMRVISP